MAKMPISLYADASRVEEPIDDLEAGVENAGIIVQLFDDVFDWGEDLSRGIYTHPIVLANQKTKSLDSVAIEEGLFYRDTFSEVIDICLPYLSKAKAHFSRGRATGMHNLMKDFEQNLFNVRLNLYSLN